MLQEVTKVIISMAFYSMYVPFCIADEQESHERLEVGPEEVKRWMAANWLKINDSKIELIVFGSK